MTGIAPAPYRPDVAIPPGETIREILESMSMTQAELANRMGRPTNKVNEVIQGKRQITADTALELELALGLPASFWLNLEKDYQLAKASLQEEKRLKSEAKMLPHFPVAEMCRLNWIEKRPDPIEQTHELLSFFAVTSFEKLCDLKTLKPAWRKAKKREASEYMLASWLNYGIQHSKTMEVAEFDLAKLRSSIPQIRSFTAEGCIAETKTALTRLCSDLGIALVLVPHLKGSQVNGAAYRAYDKVIIQVSDRGKYADIFWFTFFHELGHVILHLSKKNTPFVDCGELPAASQKLEDEADEFARDALISQDHFLRLIELDYEKPAVVEKFADSISTHPGIVAGRLAKGKPRLYGKFAKLREQFEF